MSLCLGIAGQTASQFSIGPRIGVNIASATNIEDSKSLVGLAAGITSTYSFSEKSGLTVDLLYSGEGFAHEFSDTKVKLGYLQIPILYDFFFGELGSAFRPKAYAGIAPAFLISAKQNDTDIKDSFNGLNFSIVAGLGANYRLSDQVWLNGDIRALIGLTDIRDKDIQDDVNVNSRNIQISLGVAFGLNKM
jgi:outer membrane protein W